MWGAPYFDQKNAKINQLQLLSDIKYLNGKLKPKPYLIPNVLKILLKM